MTEPAKTFLFHSPTRSLDEYRALAKEAARYKPYGRVLMLVGCLADKWWQGVPRGGSAWHEYASYNPTLANLFPHPKLAPHVDAEGVKKNQAFIRAQHDVVKSLGLEAWLYVIEPTYLPEPFFEANPHLRGARVDHPRRSTEEAFAMCIDLDETQEMYAWMTEQVARAVPELSAVVFKVNDAGSGFCWAHGGYPGPNGPQHCRGRSAGQRFRALVDAFQRGGRAAGRELVVHNLSSCFSGGEVSDIKLYKPAESLLLSGDPDVMGVGGLLGAAYPVLGLVNPLGIFASMEKWDAPKAKTVQLHFRASYDRAHESLDAIDRVFEIFEDCVKRPAKGFYARQDRLRRLALKWAGEKHAETAAQAFTGLDEAMRLVNAVASGVRPMYAGASMRHITRPLVIKPELLTDEERSWWLPHVFNPRLGEALDDTIDLHGTRIAIEITEYYYSESLMACVRAIVGVAQTFERAADAPEGKWFTDLATSLRILASVIRSSHNFCCVQKIREDYKDVLAAPPVVPAKVCTTAGHPAILPYFFLLRDELDNTNELIALLERGGLDRIRRAEDPAHEDTFLLGPDLVDQLKRKVKAMRAHWHDAENWLASPLK